MSERKDPALCSKRTKAITNVIASDGGRIADSDDAYPGHAPVGGER